MKFLLLTAYLFVLTAQIVFAEDESAADIVLNCGNTTFSEGDTIYEYFDYVKGISAQALNDIKATNQCIIIFPLANFVFETMGKDFNAYETLVKPDDLYPYLQKWGVRQHDMIKILQKVNDIPSDQLDADRKARLITFLKGIQNKATLDEIKAALTYLYGSQ